jgi:KaiC/GvpD/RAD55 family RecA-like ATPase
MELLQLLLQHVIMPIEDILVSSLSDKIKLYVRALESLSVVIDKLSAVYLIAFKKPLRRKTMIYLASK